MNVQRRLYYNAVQRQQQVEAMRDWERYLSQLSAPLDQVAALIGDGCSEREIATFMGRSRGYIIRCFQRLKKEPRP